MTSKLTLATHRVRALAWQAFTEAHGRPPSKSDSRTPEERVLGQWMYKMQQARVADTLPTDVRVILDEAAPSWRIIWRAGLSVDEQRERAHAWLGFIDAHGRDPRSKQFEDSPPEEKFLYNWMTAQRRLESKGQLAADMRTVLDEVVPGWRIPTPDPRVTPLEEHRKRAEAWAAFTETHRRQPTSSKIRSREERSLYRWIYRIRLAAIRGDLDPSVLDMLDEVAQGWRSKPGRGPTSWRENPTLDDADLAGIARRLRAKRAKDDLPAGDALLAPEVTVEENPPSLQPRQVPAIRRQLTLNDHRDRANAWVTFIETHGRQPGSGRRPPDEKTLYVWVNALRKAESEGKLASEVGAMLDDVAPMWRDRVRVGRAATKRVAGLTMDDHRELARAWSAFTDTHGEPPAQRHNAGVEEQALFLWHRQASLEASEDTLDPEVRALLEEITHTADYPQDQTAVPVDDPQEKSLRNDPVVPVNDASPPVTSNKRPRPPVAEPSLARTTTFLLNHHQERARAWRTFTETHDRRPRSSDKEPEAHSLYVWITTLRRADAEGKLAADIRHMLDEVAPQWNNRAPLNTSRPEVHVRRAADYRRFFEENGRRPSTKADDQRESSLAQWLSQQRYKLRKGNVSPAVREAIAQELPGWDTPSGGLPHEWERRIPFEQRIAELQIYMDENAGLLPPAGEQGLGSWLYQQRDLWRRDELEPSRELALDALTENWHGGYTSGKWDNWAEVLAAFVAEHARLPRIGSGEPAEQRLGRWVWDQRHAELSDSQIAVLDAAASEWRGTEVTPSWMERFHQFERFIKKHGHRPRSSAPTRAEHSLWMWLGYQRKLLRDGHLSDEHIAMLDSALPRWQRTSPGPR